MCVLLYIKSDYSIVMESFRFIFQINLIGNYLYFNNFENGYYQSMHNESLTYNGRIVVN